MIPTLLRPSASTIEGFLKRLEGREFSYSDVGSVAKGVVPEGFVEDHNRRRIGTGREDFEQAKRAIRAWRMFHLGWIEVCPAEAPIAVGSTVAILAHTMGVWTLNPARIAALIDETGAVDRFGFAYGSLAGHAESGEEQFSVEWHHDDDSVWYDLHSVSKPGRFYSWLAHPITRRIQKRFAVESMDEMAAFVASGGRS